MTCFSGASKVDERDIAYDAFFQRVPEAYFSEEIEIFWLSGQISSGN